MLRGLVICLALAVTATVLAVITVDKYASLPSARPDEISLIADDRPVVLFLGDSYTAGAGAGRGRGWVDLVGDRLGWITVNYASGGTGFTTSVSGAAALEACGRSYCPSFTESAVLASGTEPFDLVVVSGGRSDARRPQAEQTRAVDTFLRTVHERFPGTEIAATSPLWDSTLPPSGLETVATRLSRAQGVQYIALGQPLQFRAEWVSDDLVHPNDRGHQAIADAFVLRYRSRG